MMLFPKSNWTGTRPRLTISLLLAMSLGQAEAADNLFEKHEILTDVTEHQTILYGHLLGGPVAEIAALHIDAQGQRRLHVYGFEEGVWRSVLATALSPSVQFIDVARIGGRDRVLAYGGGRVSWFDPETKEEVLLTSVTTTYSATDADGLPHLAMTRDLNRDGLVDLLVPDIDGFWVAIQQDDGAFTEPVKLGPPEPLLEEPSLDGTGTNTARTYGEAGVTPFTFPLYAARVHQMDYDEDGRSDLVFWNEDHFEVYRQNDRGAFGPLTDTFDPNVNFEAEGVHTHSLAFSDDGVFRLLFGFRERTQRTMLYALRDMNGDGITDLVTLTLSGRSMLKQRSLFEVHFGRATPKGVRFSETNDTSIQPRGRAGIGEPWGYATRRFEDIDGDGQLDIMLKDVTFGLGGMVRALVANSVGMDLEFYRMKNGRYAPDADKRYKIRTSVEVVGRRNPYFPAVLLGDVNGDGRADLLTGRRTELQVFMGVPGPGLFTDEPLLVEVDLPTDGERVRLVDLNDDDKRDVLMHHKGVDSGHRLTLLIAQ
jgi:hypothetical protein